ncbi:MAG TPA: B12-binding domain-containing protein [Tepidisphaeraceae bacterium]|jgi:methanogenic corrinoid protein MtbC1
MSLQLNLSSTRLSQTYTELLLKGDRTAVRAMLDTAIADGMTAASLLSDLIWPTMESIRAMYKDDIITQMQMNLATRLNRQMTDQLAAKLPMADRNGRQVLIFCGNDEPEELGGQIAADLFEAAGWTVRFGGGGVANDEILKMVGEQRPELLVMFATLASGVPHVRKLIDYLREVDCCPGMQVMCCGGIYKRAEGLADEIGADLYAPDAAAAVEVAESQRDRRASLDQQSVGRTRRIKKAAQRREERGGMMIEAA